MYEYVHVTLIRTNKFLVTKVRYRVVVVVYETLNFKALLLPNAITLVFTLFTGKGVPINKTSYPKNFPTCGGLYDHFSGAL